MPIIFKKTSSSLAPTPGTNQITLFVDSTSGLPRLKTESGSFINLSTNLTISSTATSTVTASIGSIQRVNVSSAAVTVNLPGGHSAGDQIVVKLISAATHNNKRPLNGILQRAGTLRV